MGDISELRGLLVVITFVAVLVFCISIIPPQLIEAGDETRTVTPPDYFEAIDIQVYKETQSYMLNGSGPTYLAFYEVDVGGHDLCIWYTEPNQTTTEHHVYIIHKTVVWLIIPTTHKMHWRNCKGVSVNQKIYNSTIQKDLDDYDTMRYTIHCDHFWMHGYFGYNETLYNSVEEAWDAGKLGFLLGIQFDQTSTGYSAWDLIGMLLFFQLPDVHWAINALIAIPLWICIAYLTFIFILRAIGAIFGGGGA